jgi:hypothetical protein
MGTFVYEFEWDPAKAKLNFNKHRLDFERAADTLSAIGLSWRFGAKPRSVRMQKNDVACWTAVINLVLDILGLAVVVAFEQLNILR